MAGCGCKKGAGMSFRGGGLGGRKKKRRRKRKKKGGALVGADPRTWAPKGSGFLRNMFRGPRARSAPALARFASRAAAYVGRKRGSGMGFSGAGMAVHGGGLRTGRLFLRSGTGRRMI